MQDRGPEKPRGRKRSHFQDRYDFDILTNEYKRNHEEKSQMDWDQMYSETMKKYWERRIYDPITGVCMCVYVLHNVHALRVLVLRMFVGVIVLVVCA